MSDFYKDRKFIEIYETVNVVNRRDGEGKIIKVSDDEEVVNEYVYITYILLP